tara:strand:+ start:1066 stop:2079 length:1014 start_codon:yes stop_codon:yes gene_type:complete
MDNISATAEGKLTPWDYVSGSLMSWLFGLNPWDIDSQNTLLHQIRKAQMGIYPMPLEVTPRMLYGTNSEVAGMRTCLELAGFPINEQMFQWQFSKAFFHKDLKLACSLDGLYDLGDTTLAIRTDPKKNVHTPNDETVYLTGKGVIEHKSTGSSYETDECSPMYEIQARGACEVLDANWYAVTVSYGNDPHTYFFERNPDFAQELKEVLTDFYRRVDENDPYMPRSSNGFNLLHPEGEEQTVVLSDDARDAILAIEAAKKMKKDCDVIIDQNEMIVKEEQGDAINAIAYYEEGGVEYQINSKWGMIKRKEVAEKLIPFKPATIIRSKGLRIKRMVINA